MKSEEKARFRDANAMCVFCEIGGAEGIRTLDLLDAIEARSQLRHGPTERQLLNFSTAWRIASRTEGQALREAGMRGRNLKKVALARMVMREAARVAL